MRASSNGHLPIVKYLAGECNAKVHETGKVLFCAVCAYLLAYYDIVCIGTRYGACILHVYVCVWVCVLFETCECIMEKIHDPLRQYVYLHIAYVCVCVLYITYRN